jgi:hypothetical protein
VGKKKFDSLGAAAGNGDLAAVKVSARARCRHASAFFFVISIVRAASAINWLQDMVASGWDVNEQGKFA